MSTLKTTRAILQALESGQLDRVIVCHGKQLAPDIHRVLQRIKQAKKKIKYMGPPAFHREYGSDSDLVGICQFVKPVPLERFIQPSTNPTRLLMVDHIQDPHNFGALIRSAACFGFSGIIYAKDRQSPVTDVVDQSSAQAVHQIPLCQVTNLADTVRYLKKNDIWCYAAVATNGIALHQWQPHTPFVLMVGHEHKGVSPQLIKLADQSVRIPMTGPIASLNVSVAGGILMQWSSQKKST